LATGSLVPNRAVLLAGGPPFSVHELTLTPITQCCQVMCHLTNGQ
jgi:hypothetical protein